MQRLFQCRWRSASPAPSSALLLITDPHKQVRCLFLNYCRAFSQCFRLQPPVRANWEKKKKQLSLATAPVSQGNNPQNFWLYRVNRYGKDSASKTPFPWKWSKHHRKALSWFLARLRALWLKAVCIWFMAGVKILAVLFPGPWMPGFQGHQTQIKRYLCLRWSAVVKKCKRIY